METAFTVGWIDPEEPGAYSELFIPEVLGEMEGREDALALGVESGDIACGAAGGFFQQDGTGLSCFLLSSFYIVPEYRNMGAGSLLFDELAGVLRKLPDPPGYILTEFTTDTVETEQLYTFLMDCGLEDLDPDSEDGELQQTMIMKL